MGKRIVLACCALIFAAATASAQLAGEGAPAVEWNGLYFGGSAGAVLGRSNANTTTVFSPTGYFAATSPPAIAVAGTQQVALRGFTGSGLVGYNLFHIGPIYVGAEADFGTMSTDSSTTDSGTYPCCAPTGFSVTQSVKTKWLFTARPRVGIMLGKVLVFGTGGLALTHINSYTVFTDTFATAHEDGTVAETVTGWTVGGGFERLLKGPLRLNGQYLYTAFRHLSTTSTNLAAFTPSIAFPTNTFDHSSDFRTFVIRVGLTYRFGG